VGEALRVWRVNGHVRADAIDTATARFEALLLTGHSLGRALDQVPLDIQAWLTDAVQAGRLLGFDTLHPAPPASTPINNTGDTP
jgi:hypothetical protein